MSGQPAVLVLDAEAGEPAAWRPKARGQIEGIGSSPRFSAKDAAGATLDDQFGSGASLCAMKDGRSIDSSFGFTAVDGLCMGTRPGALDPGVVLYLFQARRSERDRIIQSPQPLAERDPRSGFHSAELHAARRGRIDT